MGSPKSPRADGAGGRRVGSEAVLDRLRAKILSGELVPGSVVSQTALAEDLGVSTTPLREVIRRLQAEGLLEVELNRRPRVAPLDVHDLHGAYATRTVLEALAVGLTVPTMDDCEVEAIAGDLVGMRALRTEGRMPEWAVVHDRFHRRMVGGAPAAVAPVIVNLVDRTERYRRLSATAGGRNWAEADAEHGRLAEACAARDGVRASHELADHLARTALALSAALAPHVDPRPVRLAVEIVTCRTPAPAPRRRGVRSSRPGPDR